jgi:DNA excision repair protein ERCC-3
MTGERAGMSLNTKPLIVQSDKTILLEVASPAYEQARDALLGFAELHKSPEHVHTYKLTPLSLWNAAASGMTAQSILDALVAHSKYPVPAIVAREITEYVARYGRVWLERRNGALALCFADEPTALECSSHPRVKPFLASRTRDGAFFVAEGDRGHIKQVLTRIGYPVKDIAGYQEGTRFPFRLRPRSLSGKPFSLRTYQDRAVQAFHAGGTANGGSGIVVLPCGAGKTVIGMGAMSKLQCETLILATSIVAVRQWIDELVDKTEVARSDVGEYTGEAKEIRPVTITTYQILTHRRSRDEDYPHFRLFSSKNWGLIIYDEVHLLPAPVFRITAGLQATRRLGLTATLVREDGQEEDVFSLIGPKKFDMPWRDLERQGWIATAECHEIRVRMPDDARLEYAVADPRQKFRIASENPAKAGLVRHLLKRHAGDQVLVIGQYLDQLNHIASGLGAPIITGKTPNVTRESLYDEFRAGNLKVLVVSKVANFAIDLPDANVAIQISGTFGSRQEEAQRLGRVLRPKKNGRPASFYSLVTAETKDQDFSAKRQLFLTEQGYYYRIWDASEFLTEDVAESGGPTD